MDKFVSLFSGKINNTLPFQKYKSKETGLQVIFVNVEGPLIQGYFCLATEAHDNDGLPHTLEHLIFLGSEDYPYKGILDKLATQSMSDGTNAWTSVDHTCYTISIAGSTGFLHLLPIFLDHIIFPTLTDHAYLTEVHHINGVGEDAGVVYCEQQSTENKPETKVYFQLMELMYPQECGYRYNTGGTMENLRNSTSIEKVRNYHKKFYRPENMFLLIIGIIEQKDIFEVLKDIELKMVQKCPKTPFIRPFSTPVPALTSSQTIVTLFSSEEDDDGHVMVGWRGPKINNILTAEALSMLFEYLTDTPTAPLNQYFIESDEAYCGEITFTFLEHSETALSLDFDSVNMILIDNLFPDLLKLLKKITTKDIPFDLKRMQNIVHSNALETLSNMEDEPAEIVSACLITDFLYGNSHEDTKNHTSYLDLCSTLELKKENFWLNLLKTYIIKSDSIYVRGEPSGEFMRKSEKKEADRIKERITLLGVEGLKNKEVLLEKAIAYNERQIPSDILKKAIKEDISKIRFHSISTLSNVDELSPNNFNEPPDLNRMPLTFQLDDIKSKFITIDIMIVTHNLPFELLPYLPIFAEAILESDVKRNGVIIKYVDFINDLKANTIYYKTSLGIHGDRFQPGPFSPLFSISIKAEQSKFEKGIQLCRDLLFGSQLTEERLLIIARKMISEVNQNKRNGDSLLLDMYKSITFNKESVIYNSSMIRQQQFLKELVASSEKKKLKKGESLTFFRHLENLETVRNELTKFNNMFVHMSCNVYEVASILQNKNISSVWIDNFTLSETNPHKCIHTCQKIKRDLDFINETIPRFCYALGLGTSESGYLMQLTECIKEYGHKDLSALMVCCHYLTQTEGLLWKNLRGKGLVYSLGLYADVDSGLLKLLLAESMNIVEAYSEAIEILKIIVNPETLIDEIELSSAKSQYIFDLINAEKSPSQTASLSMFNTLRRQQSNYNHHLIKLIDAVTADEVKQMAIKYLSPLLNPDQSTIFLCSYAPKMPDIISSFEQRYNFKIIDLKSVKHPLLIEF